jgi:hypothetical protein
MLDLKHLGTRATREQAAWLDFEDWRRTDLQRFNDDWFKRHPQRRYRVEGSSIIADAIHVFARGHDAPVAILDIRGWVEDTDATARWLLARREIEATKRAVERRNECSPEPRRAIMLR